MSNHLSMFLQICFAIGHAPRSQSPIEFIKPQKYKSTAPKAPSAGVYSQCVSFQGKSPVAMCVRRKSIFIILGENRTRKNLRRCRHQFAPIFLFLKKKRKKTSKRGEIFVFRPTRQRCAMRRGGVSVKVCVSVWVCACVSNTTNCFRWDVCIRLNSSSRKYFSFSFGGLDCPLRIRRPARTVPKIRTRAPSALHR